MNNNNLVVSNIPDSNQQAIQVTISGLTQAHTSGANPDGAAPITVSVVLPPMFNSFMIPRFSQRHQRNLRDLMQQPLHRGRRDGTEHRSHSDPHPGEIAKRKAGSELSDGSPDAQFSEGELILSRGSSPTEPVVATAESSSSPADVDAAGWYSSTATTARAGSAGRADTKFGLCCVAGVLC